MLNSEKVGRTVGLVDGVELGAIESVGAKLGRSLGIDVGLAVVVGVSVEPSLAGVGESVSVSLFPVGAVEGASVKSSSAEGSEDGSCPRMVDGIPRENISER